MRAFVLALSASTGCLSVTTYSSDPAPRAADVEVLDGTNDAYDTSVAAANDSFLVTWTENHQHPGDTAASPDIYIARAEVGAQGTAGVAFTPYASAQLQSRAFCSSVGCGV